MANEFKVKNGLIVIGDLTTSGTITINGALAATQSWVTSQAYLTSASLSGYATQSYVTSAISALIDAAPAALDTLNELAAALGDDASFSTTVTNSIAGKVAKSGDTMTGSLTFANNADGVRLQKGSSFLNLRDPYNNIHLYNAGDGTYIDANVHFWRSQAGTHWVALNSTGLGIGTSSPSEKLHVSGAAIFDGGSGNSSTDAVVYITKSTNDDWGLYVNNAGLDYGMYTRTSPSANYAFAIHNGTTWTTRITGNGNFISNEKLAISSTDSWLRLNQNNDFGQGVYTPGVMRADGGFNVSGSTVWHAGNDGSGSGLDADTLDGLHASSFLLSNFGNVEGEHSFGYPSSDGWYKIAEVVLNGTCQSYNLWGEYRDTGYFDNSHYRIHITARAECDFPSNNESHAINVNIYGSSTNETYFTNNVRVILTSSSSNYRKYELQYYRATWDTGSWRLQTLGWTTYATSQTAGTSTGTPRVYYISKFVADNIYAANKISIGTSYSGFAANIAGTTYIIGGSVWTQNGYGFTNSGSNNTGMFPDSNHVITFKNNNSDNVTINASGNVGIGTTSPNEKLDVRGNIYLPQNNYIYFDNSGHYIRRGSSDVEIQGYNGIQLRTNSTTQVYINQSGNVGVGTTSPAGKLSVEGDGTQYSNIVFKQSSAQEHLIYASLNYQYNLIGSGSPVWIWGQQGDSERMRLDNTGLGIGTTSPGFRLDVRTGGQGDIASFRGSAYPITFATTGSAGNYYGTQMTMAADAGSTQAAFRINTRYNSAVGSGVAFTIESSTNDQSYGQNPSALTYSEKFRIAANGNVGIGTTDPGSYKLYVNGGQFGTLLRGGDLGTGSDIVRMIKSDNAVAMIVRGDGNVGIGTTSPSDKLSVNGNIGIEYAGYFGFYKYPGAGHTFSTDGITSAMFGIASGIFNGRSDAGLTVSGYDQLRFYTENAERIRINRAGKVSIGTTSTNSDQSDFTVYTGGTTTLALSGGEFRVGDTDVNWNIALRQNGVLETYGQNLNLRSVAGNYPVIIQPNGVSSVSFYQSDSYINTYTKINYNWGGGDYGAEQLTIRGQYPSITLRSTNANFKWLLHTDASGNFRWYTGSEADNNAWTNRFTFGIDNNFYVDYGHVYVSGGNSTQWNTAYGWGNHASQGYATTSYVTTQINNLINGAPGALDTLSELASALGNDSSFATTVTNSIAGKVSKSGDTMTGNINWDTQNTGLTWNMNTDGAYIKFFNTGDGDTNSRLEYSTSDNGDEYHRWVIAGTEKMNLKWGGLTVADTIYASGGNSSNWNTAYGWGNHASAGYAAASSLANYLPLAGGTMSGGLNLANNDIHGVNNLRISDPGVGEGITWESGNGWGIFECPDVFDNTAGNLQFALNASTRLMTLNTAGALWIAGALTEASSLKLKENVQTSEGNLEKVVNLRPVTYNKIGSQTTELGLIAEEVAEVYPEFVQYDENGEPVGVHYSRLTAALIGAVKELTNQVQELNKKING